MNAIIVDFGMGNLRSIQHKLKKINVETVITSAGAEIEKADIIIFPGVGHFAMGMRNLADLGLIPVLNRKVLEQKTPILGICLGMQLFAMHGEEGNVNGLGWLDAVVQRFCFPRHILMKVPHIGWNEVVPRHSSPILEGVRPGQRFYFTHSYHMVCTDPRNILSTTNYGYDFVSAVHQDNIFGVQFHPEKSHEEGMTLIRNFIRSLDLKT